MERLKNITIIFLLAAGLLSSGTIAKPASVLLQEALYTEQIEGDLDAAIKLYEQVIKDSTAQRSHVAQAIYHQGMIYLKKQNEPQARAAFEKLVAEFSDQTEIIGKVQPLLDDLSTPDLADLMPPETLIYMELGSPGRQIETILNMLKGTPFANPLAAIGGGREPRPSIAGKSPGDIMAALLNPSMMAEFKKIRGMAVGITGISQNNPPMVAVLFPGKSDALRGIILAALGIVAQQGEPIEGMQTLSIQNTAGVAYDDRVIIIAQPMEQLAWCIKQYKGVTSEPTFASNNKSFAKVGKQSRQENAMTIWANADQVYSGILKLLPEDKMPREIRAADAIADFENIDDLVSFLSIQESGIALEANVSFKDGHNCLAYSMIRTPNLSRDGFKAVPAETTALVSFALAEPESPGVAKAQKAVKNLTGLDIGREIFANIEQITLFAVPLTPGTDISGPPVRMLSSVGLALTSHNPQQTQQLIAQILGIANVVADTSANEQSGSAGGKYLLPLGGGQKVYCYIGQVDKATVLAFSSEALENSLAALKKQNSALTAGRLQQTLSKIAPDTSKLVLINIGGAAQLADAYITMAYDNPQNPAHKTFAQLAQALDKTYVQLRTGESDNNFNLHVSINQIPSLDSIFPLIMQLSKIDVTAKAQAAKPQPSSGIIIGLKEDMKLNWKPGVNAKSHKVYFGTKADELSLLAEVSKPDEVNLPALEEDGQYYWCVDEVWQDGSVITGDVWSFRIGKLVGWWKFDETEGSTAADSSGNNHTGTLMGNPQWQSISGKFGGALHFDGDGDYVRIGNESDFDTTSQITVAAWIKVNKFDKDWQAIVAKGDSAWRLQRDRNTNSLEFACSGLKVPGTQYGDIHGKVDINDGQWHHATGVFDGAKIYLYIDGKLDVSSNAPGSINVNDEPVYIGENSEQVGRFWNGFIDDVRIYNYAFSEGDILALVKEN